MPTYLVSVRWQFLAPRLACRKFNCWGSSALHISVDCFASNIFRHVDTISHVVHRVVCCFFLYNPLQPRSANEPCSLMFFAACRIVHMSPELRAMMNGVISALTTVFWGFLGRKCHEAIRVLPSFISDEYCSITHNMMWASSNSLLWSLHWANSRWNMCHERHERTESIRNHQKSWVAWVAFLWQ